MLNAQRWFWLLPITKTCPVRSLVLPMLTKCSKSESHAFWLEILRNFDICTIFWTLVGVWDLCRRTQLTTNIRTSFSFFSTIKELNHKYTMDHSITFFIFIAENTDTVPERCNFGFLGSQRYQRRRVNQLIKDGT